MIERIGITGAGTMGAGIAQLACLGGFRTVLHDPDAGALANGERAVRAALLKGIDRGRWSQAEAEAASSRLLAVDRLDDLEGCQLVIEAAPEDLGLKRAAFAELGRICGADAIIATNTSSLSVSAIGAAAPPAERTCGMHFFNPPPRMRLVEIVAGRATAPETLEAAAAVARQMGREPVHANDVIGFIVNRCNRPFTLESLRIVGERLAHPVRIDQVVRQRGGFPMGPFELMDLVGIDVNLAVARSFYEQRPEPRWQPHPLQEKLVAMGRLGRKSGHGFYRYPDGRREDPPGDAAVETDEARAHLEAVGLPLGIEELDELLLCRVLCQLVNEAHFAVEEGVAARDDVDAAMRLGVNHPHGPFEWAGLLGRSSVVALLDRLAEVTGDPRYRVAPSLRRSADEGHD